MSYINETDFVIENKKLVYPEIVSDGLQLYYDAKGKRDTDYHRDTMLDMSGNKNHGKLYNFAYEKHSGYKDGLVFDYIDDKLVRPTLDLKPDDFTFMLNGNIISFSPDGTVKRVQDGEVIESKGFNLVRNGDFRDGNSGWMNTPGYLNRFDVIGDIAVNREISTNNHRSFIYSNLSIPEGNIVYTTLRYKQNNITKSKLSILYGLSGVNRVEGYNVSGNEFEVYSAVGPYGNSPHIRLLNGNIETNGNPEIYLDYLMMIDLTETFGAGKEPTKEQMDEIINRLGFIPNAQDLIDRIEYKGNDLGDMENIIDGLYKTEVLSGEEIYTDKADDAVVHVDIDGKSVGGGSGKNLLNGVNSLMRFLGSGLINTGSRTSLKAGTYTFSVQEIKGMTKWRMYWAVFKNGILVEETSNVATHFSTGGIYYSFNGNKMYLSSSDTSQKSYTIILDDDYEIAWGFSGGDSTETSEMLYPQIELGSTATTYEPPSPTPDYPIAIHSLNDFDVVSSVGRRNLIKGSNSFIRGGTNSGATSSVTSIGELQVNNIRPGSLAHSFILERDVLTSELKEGDSFTVSITMKSPDSTAPPEIYLKGGLGYFKLTGELGREYSTLYYTGVWKTENVINVHLRFSSIGTYFVQSLKLEKTSFPTPYSQAIEDIKYDEKGVGIDKINLLLSEPLRSVGDVKDRLFRDNDGVWKIERNVGEVNPYLSQKYSQLNNGPDILRFNMGAVGARLSKNFNMSSSHFPISYTDGTEGINNGYSGGNGSVFIWIKSSRLSAPNISGLTQWLKSESDNGSPLIIQYELENQTIETLDQELQDKLNNIRSFEDSNYVYTVIPNEDNYISDNLKPTLHAKFLYNNWYKEDRVINNLMIYNRALTNEEMLQNYKTIKRRWGM